MTATRARQRPAFDGLLYALLAVEIVCLSLVLRASAWFPGAQRLLAVALLGGALGLLLAHSRLRGAWGWAVAVGLGLVVAAHLAGQVLPAFSLVRGDVRRAWDWGWGYVVEGYANPDLPYSQAAYHLYWHTVELLQRLTTWGTAVARGRVSTDTAAMEAGVCLAAWLLCWNASYQLAHARRALRGLVPPAVAILINVGFTGLGLAYARLYLGVGLLACVWGNAGRMEWLWQRRGVEVAAQLRRRMAWAAVPVVSVVLGVALLASAVSPERTVLDSWGHLNARVRTFYERLDRAFAGRNPVPRATVAAERTRSVSGNAQTGNLEAHDVRINPTLGEQLVGLVHTSDSARGQDAAQHYWRERTYDRYLGYGWDTSQLYVATLPADSRWTELPYPHTVLTQTYVMVGMPGLSLAVNELSQVQSDYRFWTRGLEDLAAYQANEASYTVVSQVPQANVQQLQAAEGPYPVWVAQRYLALPEIPERVRQRAQEVVQRAGARTRFEQAQAIESYLRGFIYDTHVPAPTDGVDVVDYFLFTSRRGYCDYSATAMVVMLRALGVAARYASGYATGTYSEAEAAWVVRARNAHAWAEVYFPGYGWIEFEPTPAQDPLRRSGALVRVTSMPSPMVEPTPTPITTPAADRARTSTDWGLRWPRGGLGWLGMGGGLGLLVGIVAYATWSLQQSLAAPREMIRHVYAWLVFWARWAGAGPEGGMTPREFLLHLMRVIRSRCGPTPSTRADLELIGRVYERARYSQGPPGSEECEGVRAAWRRLRRPLWCAIVGRVRGSHRWHAMRRLGSTLSQR